MELMITGNTLMPCLGKRISMLRMTRIKTAKTDFNTLTLSGNTFKEKALVRLEKSKIPGRINLTNKK